MQTRLFGNIEIDETKQLTFENGLIGFPELKRFALIYDEERESKPGIRWLQSLDNADFAIPVTDPLVCVDDYAPAIPKDLFSFPIGDELLVLVTVTIPADITKMSINLMAPIVINATTRQAVQIITDGYEIKHYIYEELKAKREHYHKVWEEHDMTAAKAWEIYSMGIRPDDDSEYKQKYTQAIHRIRQATREGYVLFKLDEANKLIGSLGLGLQEKAAILQILKECSEK